MMLRLLLLVGTVTADGWTWDGYDWTLARAASPGTPEIVERTHRQQPVVALADRPERHSGARLPNDRAVFAPRPETPRAIRLPESLMRSIARQHSRAPTETPPRTRRRS